MIDAKMKSFLWLVAIIFIVEAVVLFLVIKLKKIPTLKKASGNQNNLISHIFKGSV